MIMILNVEVYKTSLRSGNVYSRSYRVKVQAIQAVQEKIYEKLPLFVFRYPITTLSVMLLSVTCNRPFLDVVLQMSERCLRRSAER